MIKVGDVMAARVGHAKKRLRFYEVLAVREGRVDVCPLHASGSPHGPAEEVSPLLGCYSGGILSGKKLSAAGKVQVTPFSWATKWGKED